MQKNHRYFFHQPVIHAEKEPDVSGSFLLRKQFRYHNYSEIYKKAIECSALEGGTVMNRVEIMGRLTNDPTVKYTQSDHPITISRYTLAVDRRRRKGKETKADFIPVVAYGGAGDFAAKYFHKGMRVVVCGRLESYSYLNNDGITIYGMDLRAEEQEFADGKRTDSPNDNENSEAPTPSGSSVGDGFMNIPDGVDDDGLPFN